MTALPDSDAMQVTGGPKPPSRRLAPVISTGLSWAGRFGLLAFLLILFAVFSVLRPASFPTSTNIIAILSNQSVIFVAALAVMIPLIVAEFDLSVAANVSLANTLVLGLGTNQGIPLVPAILMALVASTIVGAANGLIVTRLRVNSFVGTLGMATLLGGIVQLYTGGQDIIVPPAGLTSIARNELLGVPLAVYYAVLVGMFVYVALNHMTIGRKMLAVGGSQRAAALTGIPVERYRFAAFTSAGLLAGVAGVILGSQVGAASASGNQDLLLPVFAAALLGSTVITPGRYNVVGTAIAVLFLAITVSGLQQVGVAAWVQPTFDGTALIVAVAVSGWAIRARAARARREQLRAVVRAESDVARSTTEGEG